MDVSACMFKENSGFSAKNIAGKFSPFHVWIRDSVKDRIRYVLRLSCSPTIKEWIHFPVPATLSFIHFFLRPIRLIKESIEERRAEKAGKAMVSERKCPF